jgi:DNA-binding MarR family transcriptional regulator
MECNDNESLGRLIYLTAQEIKNFAEKLLKPYDLTLEQFHLLKQMSPDSGMSQRELGNLVNKTPANITRILDRLEQKNLILRHSNPKDRRVSHVFLTAQGSGLIKEVFAIFETFSSQLTQGTSEKEQRIAKDILNKIGANINSMTHKI